MPKLSNLTGRTLPHFVNDQYPMFVNFVKGYFEFLEKENEPFYIIESIMKANDIDESLDAYLEHHRRTYLVSFPDFIVSDIRKLIKNILKFYRAKGGEESFRFLFRNLYDSGVRFYYPKVDVLRCSDGKWNQPFYLYIGIDDIQQLNGYVRKAITGSQSEATAFIDAVLTQEVSGSLKPVLRLIDITGVFVDNEEIRITELDGTLILSGTVSPNGYIRGQGFWENTDGFLSSDKVIQDSFFYQDFSYVLRTSVPILEYSNIIRELVHPAGFKFFGELVDDDILDSTKLRDLTIALSYFVIEWLERHSIDIELEYQEFSVNYRPEMSSKRFQYIMDDWTFTNQRPMLPNVGSLYGRRIADIIGNRNGNMMPQFVNGNYQGTTKMNRYEVSDTHTVGDRVSILNLLGFLQTQKSNVSKPNATDPTLTLYERIDSVNDMWVFVGDNKIPNNFLALNPNKDIITIGGLPTNTNEEAHIYRVSNGGSLLSTIPFIEVANGTKTKFSVGVSLSSIRTENIIIFSGGNLLDGYEYDGAGSVTFSTPPTGTLEIFILKRGDDNIQYIETSNRFVVPKLKQRIQQNV